MRRGSLKGFQGEITRVAKEKNTKREFFIRGTDESTFEEAVRNSWPFKDHNVKSKWRVVSSSGEDLTKSNLSSYDRTVLVEFL